MLPTSFQNHSLRRQFGIGRMTFVMCFLACLVVSCPFPVKAQDEADSGPALTKLDAEFLSETEQLILRSLKESDPQTGPELAKAISVLLDIDLYEDARVYISQMDALGLNEKQLFELNEEIGSDFFMKIRLHEKLQPEGKAFATKVMASAKVVSQSSERLRELIETLNNKNISIRSEAFRKLRRMGEPAVAEMLNTFADPARQNLYPGIRGGLKHMGVNAQGPLLGAAYAADSQVQAEAIRALGNYKSIEAKDALRRAYLSSKVPEYLRRIALDSLSSSGDNVVDPSVVERDLYERSMAYLIGDRKYPGGLLGTIKLWNWDSKTKSLVATEVSPETAARVIASRRAEDLYEIRPDISRNRELYLLTQLESAKRMVGQNKQVDSGKLAKKLLAESAEINSLLERAMELELIPSAIACCELLGSIGDESMLLEAVGKPSSLVQAILFGDRHLQFAALDAISKIDPQQPFVGSSYVSALAAHLAKSQSRRAGLIGYNRLEVAQTFAANLADSGVFGKAVLSSKAFFNTATDDPDIEFLFVTDTLDNPQYGELIQQLRSDWRTRRLPIAFLYRGLEQNRRVLLRVRDDKRFYSAPLSTSPDLIASNVERLSRMNQPWPVTNFDRRRHAALAVKWLEKIANDPINYGFYDMGAIQDSLVGLLYIPGFANSSSKILASLGTAKAQRELVNYASQSGLPIEDRQRAAAAFSECVKRGGTLLTTSEIQQQYDRYNASEKEPVESQKVLGMILDAIEARKRSKVSVK